MSAAGASHSSQGYHYRFNLACYASATGRMGEAKDRLRNAIELDSLIRCQFAPKITRQFAPENHPPLR